MAKLPGEAEDIKDHAKDEFERLSGLAKVKGIANVAEDIMEIKKIPDIVTKTVEGFKRDMLELKEIVEDLKNNQQKYLDNGKKCSDAKLINAVPCYKHIHGEIPAKKWYPLWLFFWLVYDLIFNLSKHHMFFLS